MIIWQISEWDFFFFYWSELLIVIHYSYKPLFSFFGAKEIEFHCVYIIIHR